MPDGEDDAGGAACTGRRPAARRRQGEGFLDEDMFAGLCGGHDLFGVQRVRRGDQHRPDRRIGQRVGEDRAGLAAEVLREGHALRGYGRDAGDKIETGDASGRPRQFTAPPAQSDHGNADGHGYPPSAISSARPTRREACR